jgi:hypothetical protein
LDSTPVALPPPLIYNPGELQTNQPLPIQELNATHTDIHYPIPHELSALDAPLAASMSGADSSMPALNADATAPQSAGSAVDELGISNQESQALLQLKVERAAMVREKERKGKIDSLRAEEERLKKAIADLDNKRS